MIQLRKANRNNFIRAESECILIEISYKVHWRGIVISKKKNIVLKNGLMNPPKGGRLPHAKKVIDTKTGKIYPCIVEAAKGINRSYRHTVQMLTGKRTNTSNLKLY